MTTAVTATPVTAVSATLHQRPVPADAADAPPNLATGSGAPCRWQVAVGRWKECRPHGHVWPPAEYRNGTVDAHGHRLSRPVAS